MSRVSFKRKIHISDLNRDVHKWMEQQKDKGFVKLTSELCELFAYVDSKWSGEEEWIDALDQIIYVEYLIVDEEGRVTGIENNISLKDFKEQGHEIKLNIRSIEDDMCLEMLLSDIMVRFCVSGEDMKDYWNLVVKETGVVLKLYLLNKKAERDFWNDMLSINKSLGVINETPMVRYYLDNELLLAFKYSSAIPLPEAQTNDFVELPVKGQMTRFYVEEKIFSYNHPLGKLGEVRIQLYN